MNSFTHILTLISLAILSGCGSNALQSIGGLLESSSSQDSAAATSTVAPTSTTEVKEKKTYSSAQASICQQTKQHETFTAEASHTYTQQATKMPDVRMLWVVDTSPSMKNDVLTLANGLLSFVKRVDPLSNIQARLLINKNQFIKFLQDSTAQFPALSPTFFDELPSSIIHSNVSIISHNSLDKSYAYLENHPDFWPQNSPNIIKALVVISDGIVTDSVHRQKGTKSWYPAGFVSYIKDTKRSAGFHLFGFLDLDYNRIIYETNWKRRDMTPKDNRRAKMIHNGVPYQHYVDELGGELFHVLDAGQSGFVTTSRIDWDKAFDRLYNSIHVEIKKIAPNVVQTQCAITSVQSVRINKKRLDSSKFTIELAERLIKITTPLQQGDTIDIHYETSGQD